MLTLIPKDVLNRFSDTGSIAQTVHVMKYIFPRQFGLQNVFSITSRTGNTTPFNGHASREKEIAVASKRKSPQHIHYMNDLGVAPQRMPKRLRGQTVDLVRALRVRHARCSYSELLRHYCPLDVSLISPIYTPSSLTAIVAWPMETRLHSFSHQKAGRQCTRFLDG